MNLTEMVDELVAETNLTIYRNQIIRRVREAITSIHSSAFFDEDVEEDFISLGATNVHSNFQIQLPTRFRKFKAITPMTALRAPMAITTDNQNYTSSELGGVRNYYDELQQDVYYVAGNVVNISSSVAPSNLYISWYSNPEVADGVLETWVMKQYPQMVMDWAISRFWKRNGREALAKDIERTLYSVDLQNLINNHATGNEL